MISTQSKTPAAAAKDTRFPLTALPLSLQQICRALQAAQGTSPAQSGCAALALLSATVGHACVVRAGPAAWHCGGLSIGLVTDRPFAGALDPLFGPLEARVNDVREQIDLLASPQVCQRVQELQVKEVEELLNIPAPGDGPSPAPWGPDFFARLRRFARPGALLWNPGLSALKEAEEIMCDGSCAIFIDSEALLEKFLEPESVAERERAHRLHELSHGVSLPGRNGAPARVEAAFLVAASRDLLGRGVSHQLAYLKEFFSTLLLVPSAAAVTDSPERPPPPEGGAEAWEELIARLMGERECGPLKLPPIQSAGARYLTQYTCWLADAERESPGRLPPIAPTLALKLAGLFLAVGKDRSERAWSGAIPAAVALAEWIMSRHLTLRAELTSEAGADEADADEDRVLARISKCGPMTLREVGRGFNNQRIARWKPVVERLLAKGSIIKIGDKMYGLAGEK